MGKVGWHDNVLVRVGSSLLCFSYDQNTGDVTVFKTRCITLSDVECLCDDIHKKSKYYPFRAKSSPTFVLHLDMQETEVNPTFTIPFFTSWATREADDILKKFFIVNTHSFLSDAPSFPELFFMREVLEVVDSLEAAASAAPTSTTSMAHTDKASHPPSRQQLLNGTH